MSRHLIVATFALLLSLGTAQAQEKLIVLGYGGATEDVYRNVLIPKFEKDHNVQVVYIPGRSEDNYARALVESKQQTAAVDVIFTTHITQFVGNNAGIWAPLNLALIKNLPDIVPMAKSEPWGKYGLAYGLNAVVMGYRPEIFASRKLDLPQSWFDLKNPQYSQWLGWVEPGGSDFPQIFDAFVGMVGQDKAYNFFGSLSGHIVNSYSSSGAELALQQGEVGLIPLLNGRLMILKSKGVPVARIIPKEGAIANLSGLAIVKSSAHVDLGSMFIDAALSPEIQQLFASKALLGNTNSKVTLPPELTQELFSQDQIKAMRIPDLARISQQSREWVAFWDKHVNH